jgi:hypothetical protein
MHIAFVFSESWPTFQQPPFRRFLFVKVYSPQIVLLEDYCSRRPDRGASRSAVHTTSGTPLPLLKRLHLDMVDCTIISPCLWLGTATRVYVRGIDLTTACPSCLQPFVVPRLPLRSTARSPMHLGQEPDARSDHCLVRKASRAANVGCSSSSGRSYCERAPRIGWLVGKGSNWLAKLGKEAQRAGEPAKAPQLRDDGPLLGS